MHLKYIYIKYSNERYSGEYSEYTFSTCFTGFIQVVVRGNDETMVSEIIIQNTENVQISNSNISKTQTSSSQHSIDCHTILTEAMCQTNSSQNRQSQTQVTCKCYKICRLQQTTLDSVNLRCRSTKYK